MNQRIAPHPWIRAGASVYLVRIAKVDVAAAGPGMRTTKLQLSVEEVLFGSAGATTRRTEIIEPESETARLKFPAPQWGAVTQQPGVQLLLATSELGEDVKSPAYVAQIGQADEPILKTLRGILSAEAAGAEPAARRQRYLSWLSAGNTIERLFGGAALARDGDLPDIDPQGEVASAYARALGNETDPFVKVSLIDWMWSAIYPRSNEAGRVALLNASLVCVANGPDGPRGSCLDKLSGAPADDIDLPGLIKQPAATIFLEDRIAEETAADPKARLQKLLAKTR